MRVTVPSNGARSWARAARTRAARAAASACWVFAAAADARACAWRTFASAARPPARLGLSALLGARPQRLLRRTPPQRVAAGQSQVMLRPRRLELRACRIYQSSGHGALPEQLLLHGEVPSGFFHGGARRFHRRVSLAQLRPARARVQARPVD